MKILELVKPIWVFSDEPTLPAIIYVVSMFCLLTIGLLTYITWSIPILAAVRAFILSFVYYISFNYCMKKDK